MDLPFSLLSMMSGLLANVKLLEEQPMNSTSRRLDRARVFQIAVELRVWQTGLFFQENCQEVLLRPLAAHKFNPYHFAAVSLIMMLCIRGFLLSSNTRAFSWKIRAYSHSLVGRRLALNAIFS